MTARRSHARAFTRTLAPTLLAAWLLTACGTPPTKPGDADPQTIKARATNDAKRIEDLERQVAELQKQLADRRRQSLEDKRRLEESQKKLEAILAIDRELRRGNKGAE